MFAKLVYFIFTVVWEYGHHEVVGWLVAERGIRQHPHVLRTGPYKSWMESGKFQIPSHFTLIFIHIEMWIAGAFPLQGEYKWPHCIKYLREIF